MLGYWKDAGMDWNPGRISGQGLALGRTKSPESLRNKYMWRRSAIEKPRFRGRATIGSKPSGSFSAQKLGRGSERFRAW
mgnify:CR=1 FL=1